MKFYIKLAELLDVMHSKGIVHNEIRPENIVVDEDENPMIIDFSLAKPIDHIGIASGPSAYLDRVKLESMMLRAPQSYSPASDIYSFVVTMFFLENFDSDLYAIFYRKFKKLSDIVSELTKEIRSLFRMTVPEVEKKAHQKQIQTIEDKIRAHISLFDDIRSKATLDENWMKSRDLLDLKFPVGLWENEELSKLLATTNSCQEYRNKCKDLGINPDAKGQKYETFGSFLKLVMNSGRSKIVPEFATKLAPYFRRFYYYQCPMELAKQLIV